MTQGTLKCILSSSLLGFLIACGPAANPPPPKWTVQNPSATSESAPKRAPQTGMLESKPDTGASSLRGVVERLGDHHLRERLGGAILGEARPGEAAVELDAERGEVLDAHALGAGPGAHGGAAAGDAAVEERVDRGRDDRRGKVEPHARQCRPAAELHRAAAEGEETGEESLAE